MANGVLGLALVWASCHDGGHGGTGVAGDGFLVSGRLSGLGSGWVVLSHEDAGGDLVLDSIRAAADSFRFRGRVAGDGTPAALYQLSVPGAPGEALRFFLGNEQVTVEGSRDAASQARVDGAAAQGDYLDYQALMRPLEGRRDSLNQAYLNAYGTPALAAWDSASGSLDTLETNAIRSFVMHHPASAVSAWALLTHYRTMSDTTTAEAMYGLLKKNALSGVYAARMRRELETARAIVPGKPAPPFSLPDTSGHEVSLRSLRGSYVLIHFWASWYGPGRTENAEVRRALTRYRAHGLKVVGVSLDRDREAWLGAIRREHLDWTQLSDLKGWNSSVALNYGVLSLPGNILVDPKGVILGRNLMGGHLEGTLKKLLE